MRYLLAIFLTASASASVINTNDMRPRTSYPTRIGATYNPTLEQLREAGWREYQPCESIAGSNVVSTIYLDDGDTVTASCEYAAIPAPVPAPAEFPEGIEVPWVTILSITNQVGWLYVALDDGTLVPVLAHESPWPSQSEINRRIESARTNAIAARQQRIATTRDIATKAAAANSVPALRAEVRRLAELLERE